MQSNKNKEKRIDKEIFLLRNLPKQFKMGKKETQLGVLIDVSEVNFLFLGLFFTNSHTHVFFLGFSLRLIATP